MADTWVLDPKNKNRATYTDPDGRIFEVFNEDTSEIPMAGEEPLEYGVPRLVPPQKEPQAPESTFQRRLKEAQGERPGLDTANEFGGPKVFENGIPNPLSTIRDIADLGARGGEYIGAAFNTALEGMDNLVKADAKDFGSMDQITNALGLPEIRPGAAIGALSEAFPLGGAEMGLANPASAAASAEYRTAISKAQDAFKKGGTREDIKAASGIDYGPELDKAIEIRDSGGNARIGDAPETNPTSKTDPALEQEAAVKQTAEMFGIPEDRIAAALEQPDFQNQVEVTLQQNRRGGIPEDEQALGARTPEEVPNDGRGAQTTEQPAPEATPVQRLTDALKEANSLNPEQKALYSAERSKRAGELRGNLRNAKTEEEVLDAMKALKGELPKVEYESLRGKFTQDDIDSLFKDIAESPNLSPFETATSIKSFAKLLNGKVPTPSEIAALSKVFPQDLIKEALKHRTKSRKMADFFEDVVNLPRSLMSSMDFSAPLRQGVFLVGRKEFYNALPKMFTEFYQSLKAVEDLSPPSRGNWKSTGSAVLDEIKQRPTYDLMERAGLDITERSADLTKREESFMSPTAEKIPIAGRLVKATDAAYTGFLNKLRADTFDSFVKLSRDAGIDLDKNPKTLRDMAKFINSATGRGELSGKFAQAGPLLNAAFYSPKLIKSRVDLLNPVFYSRLDPLVRKEAIKSLLAFGAITSTALVLAKMGGAEVETDSRSSDFAKIKTGDTRYDILGGFGQYMTLATRLATNEKKQSSGEIAELGGSFAAPTRLDTLLNFGMNKFAPIPSYVRDYLKGSNPVGEEFNAKDNAVKMFIPLFLQDAKEIVDSRGVIEGVPMAVPGLFGVGTQTYSTVTQRDLFGREAPSPEEAGSPETDPAILEVARLSEPLKKSFLSLPSRNIPDGKTQQGERKTKKLSDDEYERYATLSGFYMTSFINQAMESDEWASMDDISRRKEIRTISNLARKNARETLFNQPNSGGEEGTTDE